MDKKIEFETCSGSNECLGPMNCTNGICQCSAKQYFNDTTLECKNQTLANVACTNNHTCRTDLNLYCNNQGFCSCAAPFQFWKENTGPEGNCSMYLYYGESACAIDSDCAQTLICNLNVATNNCTCPIFSTSSSCDCPRVVANETYWDPLVGKCVPASSFGQPCTSNYMCQTFTQKTTCNSSNLCDCVNGELVNGICKYCSPGWTLSGSQCFIVDTNCASLASFAPSTGNSKCATDYPGSTLAFFTDPLQLKAIASILPNTWIGVQQISSTWSITDGTTIYGTFTNTYSAWCSGQPNGGSTCATTAKDINGGCMQNQNCNSKFNCLCSISF